MSSGKEGRARMGAAEFVRIWQTSKSGAEVVAQTGLSLKTASQRATKYRQRGVPLQRFVGRRYEKPDWPALTALAEELAPTTGRRGE